MAYGEISCQFCRTTLNIRRLRRADEPEEAGWIGHREGVAFTRCNPQHGCSFAELKKVHVNPKGRDAEYEDDESYVYESDLEDPYEYESDDDVLDTVMEDVPDAPDSFGETELHEEAATMYRNFVQSIRQLDSIRLDSVLLSKVDKMRKIPLTAEHIAGPTCTNGSGYNGHHISVEQMKGCTTFQGILRKSRRWKKRPSDEDFEIDSRFYLSGLGHLMPSRDMSNGIVHPVRHGVQEIMADNISSDPEIAMPFHPTCFEIYKIVSQQKAGVVDIDNLMTWFYSDDDWFEYDSGEYWDHKRGDEWMAANPLYVPYLDKIFQASISLDPITHDENAFPHRTSRPPNRDLFHTLPQELRRGVINHLPSRDIANLRLSSRAFEQLPIALWYHLLRKEMPWLWEIWANHKPSIWSFTDEHFWIEREKKETEYQEEIVHYRKIIKKENPELLEDWQDSEPSFDELHALPKAPSYDLPPNRTNWYILYSEITRNWKVMPGLQKRARVWQDVNTIAGFVREVREQES